MTRTTLDIDPPILEQLKRLKRRDGKSMGVIVSRLLAEALASQGRPPPQPEFDWHTAPMRARIDLADKDVLYAALDEG